MAPGPRTRPPPIDTLATQRLLRGTTGLGPYIRVPNTYRPRYVKKFVAIGRISALPAGDAA